MHPEVLEHVESVLDLHPIPYRKVVEFGSRDINGSVRPAFGDCEYVGIDTQDGPGVDVVADAKTFSLPERVDVVVCCEVLEHAPSWRALVTSAARLLRVGGMFIVTCAGPGREPHSGIDEQPLRPTEHYANIEPEALQRQMQACFSYSEVWTKGTDVQGYGIK